MRKLPQRNHRKASRKGCIRKLQEEIIRKPANTRAKSDLTIRNPATKKPQGSEGSAKIKEREREREIDGYICIYIYIYI